MIKLRILAEAKQEIDEARQWYEARQSGLGARFLDSIDEAIEAVSLQPKTWPSYHWHTRAYRLRKFPYRLVYRYDEKREEILLVAIAHAKRRPRYWSGRIEEDQD